MSHFFNELKFDLWKVVFDPHSNLRVHISIMGLCKNLTSFNANGKQTAFMNSSLFFN